MLKKQKVFQISIWLLILIIGMVIISGKGCPKRSKNRLPYNNNHFTKKSVTFIARHKNTQG